MVSVDQKAQSPKLEVGDLILKFCDTCKRETPTRYDGRGAAGLNPFAEGNLEMVSRLKETNPEGYKKMFEGYKARLKQGQYSCTVCKNSYSIEDNIQ